MTSRFFILVVVLISVAASAASIDHAKREFDAAGGWALFKRTWVSAPSSQADGAGLGPLFDARSCNACHAGGGAGRVTEDAIGSGLTIRVGRSDGTPDPVYGTQMQTQALPGLEPEVDAVFRWNVDGDLRTASLGFEKLHYGALTSDSRTGLRRAPSLFGIGLLEDVPESVILGQSHGGHPSWIEAGDGTRKLGRWGWKATTPELTSQIEIAFQRDFGISTPGHPQAYGECTPAEKACRAAATDGIEVPRESRDVIAAYLRFLRHPAPKNEAIPGFALFGSIGCADCHATLTDSRGRPVHAYTDMLLHDMGAGLDDGIAEGAVRSPEWRTAPLWDIASNLSQGGLLHDGRARSIAEAVQWHAGEGAKARAAFSKLSPVERTKIEDFLLDR